MTTKKNVLTLILTAGLCFMAAINAVSTHEFIRNYNLPILHKDTHRNIYQIQSIMDLGGWTCGFFTLKNARDLECLMGINKPCDIKDECDNYLDCMGINPHNAIDNKQLVKLADEVVRLKSFNALHLNKQGHVSIIPESITWNVTKATNVSSISTIVSADRHQVGVTIQAPYRTTQDQITTIVDRAVNNELYEKLINLNTVLNNSEIGVLNFGCMLTDETHVMLISVIQLDNMHRALLVYDNLNKPYNSTPTRKQFVDTLYNIFCA